MMLLQPLQEEKKGKTSPFGVNSMRSPVLYSAAQGLRGIQIVLARPVVPPIPSSLQRITTPATWCQK